MAIGGEGGRHTIPGIPSVVTPPERSLEGCSAEPWVSSLMTWMACGVARRRQSLKAAEMKIKEIAMAA